MERDEAGAGDFQAADDWRGALRDHRLRLRFTQPEVARRSGLSVSAIKAYETGSRHPTREALSAIIDALGLTVEQSNPLLAGAGYATNWRAIHHEAYGPRSIEWFAAEVEKDAWPVFVTNEASDLIAANRCFRNLVGIPLSDRLPDGKWNFVANASDPAQRERLDSWDDSMRFMIGLAKGDLRRHVNPERPVPWTTDANKRFLQGDPALVTRMLQLWSAAEPVEHTTRMRYPVRWRHESGQLMRFTAVMHVADVWNVFAWHDWIPADAETLKLLC